MNKIDSNKLLSPSKNSAIQKKIDSSVLVPYKSIKISTKKITLGKKSGEEKDSDDELIKTISSIKESLLQIESLLKSNSNILAKKLKKDKKDKENEKRKEKETQLESKKSDKDKFPNLKKPNLPRTGILDYIKNFLTWVIIGRAFVLFSKYLPKLLEFVKYLTPLYDFVKTITGALFNGLVTFVEWTDKAQKKLKEVVGSLGGEPFQKAFDDFGGALNTFMNLALIAGMATMGGSDLGVGDALDDIDPDGKNPKRPRGKKPRITTSGGRRAGRPGLRNPLRQKPKITGTPGLKNPLRQKPKITGTPGPRNPLRQKPKITGASNAPKLPTSAGSAGRVGAKALLKTVRPLLRGMVIGGLIDFGISVALGEDPGRAAFGAIGATLLGTIGGILGGPFAPFTAIGGGMLGDWAGRKLYDAFFSEQKSSTSSKPPVAGGGMGGRRGARGMQGGGSVKPKTGTPLKPKVNKTSTEKVKQPIILPPKKVKPGKDIGGETKIKKLFPNTDPKEIDVLEWVNAVDANGDRYAGTYEQFVEAKKREYKNKPNPFKALTRTSDILKRIPVVGTLMGAGIDAALGQAFDAKIIIGQFTSAMGYIVDSISRQQISNLENSIKTFSEGGSISPSESIDQNYNKLSSAELLEKLLGPSIEKRVNRAVSGIKNDIDKAKPPEREDGGPGGPDGGGADEGTPGARLRDGSNAKIEADLLEYFTALYGKNAAIGIVANLRRESGYRTRTPDNNLYEGMAQWSRDDRWPKLVKWAESKGLDPYSRNAQAQYLAIELKQLGTDKRIKQAKTPEEAASIFYNEFERGAYSKPVRGNAYDPDNAHENKNKDFIKDITKSNPDIGKRAGDVLEKPTFDAKVSPGTFKPVTGTSGSSSLNPNVPLSIPYSPFTSDLGRPKISSAKGKRYHPTTGQLKDHNGLDIEADSGTPIYAYLPGTVVFSGSAGGYGFRVEIKDSKGNIHSFSHLQNDPGFKTGQKVQQGQLIGRVGSTGQSTGPHLHWEIQNSSGAYLDPVSWTKQNPLPQPKSKLQLAQDKISSMKLGDAPYEVPGYGKVVMKKNEFGTVVKEYYDPSGNLIDSGQFFESLKSGKPISSSAKPGQQPEQKAQSFNASQIAYANLNDRVSKLKPGEKIVFDKVGSIQAGRGWLGRPQIKYYNSSGSSISKEDFDKLLAPSEILKRMRSNDRQVQNLQGGGNINMNYKKIQRTDGLNTYEDDEDVVVYIQPIYFIPDQNQTYIKSNPSISVSSGGFINSSQYIP